MRKSTQASSAAPLDGQNVSVQDKHGKHSHLLLVLALLPGLALVLVSRSPREVLLATEAYRRDEDQLEQFISDRCSLHPQASDGHLAPLMRALEGGAERMRALEAHPPQQTIVADSCERL